MRVMKKNFLPDTANKGICLRILLKDGSPKGFPANGEERNFTE